MKKTYMMPKVLLEELQVEEIMITFSTEGADADDSPILSRGFGEIDGLTGEGSELLNTLFN